MSTISFDFQAKDEAVQKALVGQQREISKLLAKVAELSAQTRAGAKEANEWTRARERSSKAAADEMAKLGAAADKIRDQIRTPFERAQQATATLREHLQAGRLTTDEYRAALARVARELKDQTRDHEAEAKAQATSNAMDREAAKVLEATRSAAERNAEAIAKLSTLHQQGRIDTETYSRAVAAENQKLQEATRDHEAEAKAQATSNAMDREAARVIDSTRTATERFAVAADRLNRLRAAGKISAEQHSRAMDAEAKKAAEASTELDEAAESGGRFGNAMSTMSVAAGGAVIVLRQMLAAVHELQQSMADTTRDFDTMSRKFGIQGGLSDADRKTQSRLVGDVAMKAAVPLDKAFQAATQLSSSGFEDPVKSGTLDTALALIQSSNQIDANPAEFIKGSSQFLSAFGRKKDQANLADLGIRMQGLFKSTDVQAADLSEFAKAAPVLSQANLSLEESLSMLTALRETMSASEAATGGRNVVSLLQTAGAKKSSTDALASLGLSPQDVDIQGEGLKESLSRLQARTAQLGEADRAKVLTDVFGRENIAAAQILMQSADKLDRFGAMQQGARVAFQADVTTARTGIAADKTRADVRGAMDSANRENAVRETELLRLARISLREEEAKRAATDGTLTGRLKAGLFSTMGALEDTVVRPLIGESIQGPAHARRMEDLANRGPNAAAFRMPPLPAAAPAQPMPQPLPQQPAENPPDDIRKTREQAEKQTQLLREISRQNAQQKHAGIVAGRMVAGREGVR